jgi:ParB family chromosome partitioning protein
VRRKRRYERLAEEVGGMAKKVLGKGLWAISSARDAGRRHGERDHRGWDRIIELDVYRYSEPDQPRSTSSKTGINSLAESIRTSGLLQPIFVRKDGPSYFVMRGSGGFAPRRRRLGWFKPS